MYATVNGVNVPLSEIALDDMGWDHAETRGPIRLVLHLDESDLIFVGKSLLALAREFESEESGYFEGEFRDDIPVPRSERMFVDNPELLAQYLEYNSFWSRETIIAILNKMHASVAQPEPSRYWIQDFKGVLLEDGNVAVKLGASTA